MIDVIGDEGEPAPADVALPGELPVLPLRDSVTYPDTLTPLAIGQERSVQLVNDVLTGNRMLVMVASREPEEETPGPDQLYDIGVAGMVARMLKVPDGSLRILVQGGQRVRIESWEKEKPYLTARDFARETLVTYPIPDERLDLVREVLRPAKVDPPRRETELTVAILQLVASGRGVAALPGWTVQCYIDRGYVESRPIGKNGLRSRLYAATTRAAAGLAYMREFLRIMREVSFATLDRIEPLK